MTQLNETTLLRQDDSRSYFSDGTVLLRVRGGDGEDPQSATVAALEGQGGQQQQGAPQQGGQAAKGSQAEGEEASELANGFLARVDPAHRPIVEPYVKQWDAGVTRRFQELHGELNPYKELGDVTELQQARQLYQMIDTEPERVLELLKEVVGETQQGTGAEGQKEQPGGAEGETPGLPPEVTQKLELMENVLEALSQRILDQDSSAEQEQEDQQLEEYFENLKTEFGDFDEDFVAAKMLGGLDGPAAVEAYREAIQSQVNQRAQRPNVGPVLSGGGAIPQEGQRITKASSGEVKNLVANILAQNQSS